jgi:uncharacterized membrane protein
MHHPVVFAIIAMVCYGIGDFIYKRGTAAGVRADHFLMAQGWFFGPLVVLYALVTGTLALVPAALWGSLAGLFVFIGFYLFVHSLAAGAVSTNSSIFRMNFLVTVALVVVFLHEPLTAAKVAGLALALLATWLLVGAGADTQTTDVAARRRSLLEVGIATLAFGTSTFFHTLGLRHGAPPETLAAAQAAVFVPLATAVVYVTDRGLAPSPLTLRYGAVAAVALLGATISLLRGVAAGQASVLVPIAQMGFIIAALLGFFVLRERVTVRKASGLACALTALAVLAMS